MHGPVSWVHLKNAERIFGRCSKKHLGKEREIVLE